MKLLICISLILFTNLPLHNQQLLDNCQKYGRLLAPSYTKKNCVQFLDALLKIQLRDKITSDISKTIYIDLTIEEVGRRLKIKDSTKVTGVCFALTKANLANWVPPEKAIAGDIFQYWNTVGFVNGHCGIIKSTNKDGSINILSSHCDTKGYGEMRIEKPEYLFVVRLK